MTTMTDAAAALTFVWVGLVVGISFLEAPVKFRAPGVTIPIGLGIGRLVFRVLNRVELVLAVLVAAAALVTAVAAATAGTSVVLPLTLAIIALILLLAQLIFVRPRLNKRSDAVLSGGSYAKRSSTHLYYVGLEVAKLVVLIALGVALLAALS